MEGSEKNRDESRRTLSSIVTSGRVTNVVHLFIVAFAVYMLYLSFSGTIEFFTWHPILMSVGVSSYVLPFIKINLYLIA